MIFIGISFGPLLSWIRTSTDWLLEKKKCRVIPYNKGTRCYAKLDLKLQKNKFEIDFHLGLFCTYLPSVRPQVTNNFPVFYLDCQYNSQLSLSSLEGVISNLTLVRCQCQRRYIRYICNRYLSEFFLKCTEPICHLNSTAFRYHRNNYHDDLWGHNKVVFPIRFISSTRSK